MKKYDRDKVERSIIAAVNAGYNTTREIANKVKLGQSSVNYVLGEMVKAEKLHLSKSGRMLYFSTVAPSSVPAHDPFGLCHENTTTSNQRG